MKHQNKIYLLFCLILVIFVLYISNSKATWSTYYYPGYFPIDYPKNWGNPQILNDEQHSKFNLTFEDNPISVTNGYYFYSKEKRPTIYDFLNYYEEDMKVKNEIKMFSKKDIIVDSRPATMVEVQYLNNLTGADIFVYTSSKDDTDYILLRINKDKIDDMTIERILKNIKIYSVEFTKKH